MTAYTHTLSDGLTITIELSRSAKKNLILRPHSAHSVRLNVPPFVSSAWLAKWLRDNETVLRQTLAKTPAAAPENNRPEWIWYQGRPTRLADHNGRTLLLNEGRTQNEILLPQGEWQQQQRHLQHFLYQRAADDLLPRLQAHAHRLNLHPAAMALSRAKTLWGVCRHRTGIRLNWRLIGAPEFVADYVCVHELCHLPHPDHSPRFWHLVKQSTPHTEAATRWLKQHGQDLFVLG